MSRIDYSRWDNIELSDDEDIEGHPNVDHKSLVRWRQEQIRKERAERRHAIEQYKKQLPWLQAYLDLLQHFPTTDQTIIDKTNKHLSQFHGLPAELLFTTVPPVPPAFDALRQRVTKHREVIRTELAKLEADEGRKLASDTICKPGFDKTVVAKSSASSSTPPSSSSATKAPAPASAAAAAAPSKSETVEVLNPKGVQLGKERHAKEAVKVTRNDEDQYIKSDEALYFANLSATNYEALNEYLREHRHLVSKEISDEILASAFQYAMNGRFAKADHYVHQATVLQFCANLGPDGAPMFFTRIKDPNHRAAQMFHDDVARTVAHIHNRSKVLQAKAAGKVTGISLDPVGKKMDVFRTLPNDLQQALLTEDLEKVHAVLGARKDGSDLLKQCRAVGLIQDQAVGEVSDEEKLELIRQLPAEFRDALANDDFDKVNELLESYEEPEAERVIELCKRAGIFEDGGEEEFESAEDAQAGVEAMAAAAAVGAGVESSPAAGKIE
ncbi:hypothetical protein AMAG_05485 [Allomyces macrogynus ATCC 38327]|uniref:Hsp90 chaperone protein kinase-targeting subunit n=1 Tax=Allomyces macrogynus (strain ATCC 38327) TaxID=578462 RepID=A0A0L0SC36_ALLM3|nr:hypothetical protein AMAG_05485 [Allomyces macrogynus ATCC 38327]|eukprot:KNE60051.1 hypothetical protein AMAG_05485 [Allomyces macrogynus ATCC 38327]